MKRIFLVDAHALLWAADSPERIGNAARDALINPDHTALASAATLWELAIKANLGKLEIPVDFFARLEAAGYRTLHLDRSHFECYRNLPLHHRDPFDRMIIAQAMVEGITIISEDAAFKAYGIEVLW